jgi:type VI protein secretion system component VasK
LLEPFDAAYSSGEANLAQNLGRWWESKRQELERAVSWRFPFNEYSTSDAAVADVLAWLTPREGRFFTEVQPIFDLVNQCAGKPCVPLPSSMAATVARTNAIVRALFDDKGQPKQIALEIEPIPFQAQRFAPRRSSFRLEALHHDYFNTAPRAANLLVPWNEARVARVEVELVGEAGVDGFAVPVDTDSSPWAMFHLLQRAKVKSSARYQWELDVTGGGVRIGTTQVSYRVCQDVTLCNGLFTEAFQWL